MINITHLRSLRPLFKVLSLLLMSFCVLLMIAHFALTYYTELENWRQTFHRTRWYWLGWRIFLYIILSMGLWKLYNLATTNQSTRKSLIRSSLTIFALILVSEFSLWAGEPPL